MQKRFASLVFIAVCLLVVCPIHAAPPSTTTTGTRVGLVLMAQFPDRPGDVSITPADIDAFCNDPDYTAYDNATSVYGYFRIQSNGRLQYNNVVTAYFTAAQNRDYYTDNAISFGTRAKELINEGLAVLKTKGFDFTQCDADNNGILDGVSLLYAGSNVNSWAEGLWHHKWSSSWAGLSGEGVSTSFQYQISAMGTDLSIGTFCFESAHMICDFPDLYSYSGNAANIGQYSLMHSSGTKHPVNIDAYLKIHAGWATVTDLDSSDDLRGAVSVDNNTFYRFRNPGDSREYFILSMRTNTGYEGPYGGALSAVNPANGLVIWHALENGSNTYSSIYTADSPATDYTTPYELMVVEANSSSATTPWYDDPNPGSNDAYHSADVSQASDATTPALKFWNTSTGRTTPSNLEIHSVSGQGEAISFVVGSGTTTGTPGIGLTPTALTPSCDYGTDAPAQTFAVFNSGGGTLNYTISESVSWLGLDVFSGTATTEADFITLTYDTAALAYGTYNGTITVTDGDAGNSPQAIPVVLTVKPPPIIATSTQALDKSLSAGASATDAFSIANSGGGTLYYTLSESSSWLTLNRTSGTAAAETDEIQVTYDASDLFGGIYSAEIMVSNASAGSPSQTIAVTLDVSGHILVQSPGGAETLWPGNRHNITWMTDGQVTGDVKIELYKGGVPHSTIASGTANDGRYQWQIPDSQAIGTDYRIRITSVDSPSIYGECLSDFAIAALPALTDVPYTESFEAGFGAWTQTEDDGFDWTRDNGGTPSSATGPPFAQDGSYYLYTESSSPNYPVKSARLEGTFDLRDATAPMLSFYYHMYGATMGTLAVRASIDQVHWTTLFSRTGNQGNAWQAANADLSQFVGQVVLIQIIGTTGSSFASDMALDLVSIQESYKTLTCDTRTFTENSADDGSISNDITITLAGDTFTSTVVSGGNVTAGNVPSGLTAAFVRDSSTRITVTLTGNAICHDNKDTISDLRIQFADGAFSTGDAAAIAGNTQTLTIDYIEITMPNSDPAITGLPTDIRVLAATASNVDLSPAAFSDADSADNSIRLTLSAGSGTLSAAGDDTVTVTGTGTGTLVLSGTAAAIDAFLNTAASIQYTGAAGVTGNDADTLTLTANDGGYTGDGGGTDVGLGTVNIDIDVCHLLSVTKSGIGLGTVTSEPAGIDCGRECSQVFSQGTTITLTATAADAFSWFAGWSGGGCSGTGDCVVPLTGDTAVTAVFEAADRDDDGIPDHLDAFPDDPDYNDDGDHDGMPTAWEVRYGLNPAMDDAGLDADGDGLSNLNEFIKGTDPRAITTGPGIAILEAPDDFATEQALTPTLETGYATTASPDAHAKTCWQIAGDEEFTMSVFKITSSTFKTRVPVPLGILDAEATYYWRAHYIDTDDITWAWAAPWSFDTRGATDPDDNGNGLPDSQEVPAGSFLDLDQDTVDDLTQDDMHCLALQEASAQICLKNGATGVAVETFSRMAANAIEEEIGRPEDLPAGLFSFRLQADEPGAVVSVTMYFSAPLPDDTVWYTYNAIDGWQDCSAHATISDGGQSVVLELVDGGYGDADGIANGIVVDTSGPGSTLRDSSGGGGCFIDTACAR